MFGFTAFFTRARVMCGSFDGGLCVHLAVLQTVNTVCLLILFFVLFSCFVFDFLLTFVCIYLR